MVTFRCIKSHACVITTTSALMTSVAARSSSPPASPITVAVAFQPTTGHSKMRSPCVSGGACTTSYQPSFIGTIPRALVNLNPRLPAGQVAGSEFDLFREQNSSPALRRENTSNWEIYVRGHPSVQRVRGGFATSMLEFRTWRGQTALGASGRLDSAQGFCYPQS
ncbi:exported hypothetical protein [Candidatus Sulfopaludibacter sp. SbA4]|nr:exported hypothetical protein [Candidatus Sulfopaludibacter sp. SbA4]